MASGVEPVSTVFIAGFPPEATERELDNLCRFMPGFVDSKVDFRRGNALFVLFSAPQQARAAIAALNGQPCDRKRPGEPLRAVLARSNMRAEVPSAWPAPAPQPGGQQQRYQNGCGGSAWAVPSKRPRIPEDPGDVDTVACVGALDAGFDELALEDFLAGLRGFVAFKANPRMGGGFAKFESPALAVSALSHAAEAGVPAQMARSSMGTPPARSQYATEALAIPEAVAPAPAVPPGAAKRPRIPESPHQIDTVASVGASEAGFDAPALEDFFASLSGFVAFKANPRMGGGFAKFESASLAAAAVVSARDAGVPVEMARSSMGSMPEAAPAPVPTPTAAPGAGPWRPRIYEEPSEVDTLASIGAGELGFDAVALEAFFKGIRGFVAFKANARMGGGFAKFASHELARQAMAQAAQQGVPASLARSSMSTLG